MRTYLPEDWRLHEAEIQPHLDRLGVRPIDTRLLRVFDDGTAEAEVLRRNEDGRFYLVGEGDDREPAWRLVRG